MAAPFNLVAQLQIQGPTNLNSVVRRIQSALSSVTANVNVTMGRNTVTNLTNVNTQLVAMSTNLIGVTTNANNAATAIQAMVSALGGVRGGSGSVNINSNLGNVSKAAKAASNDMEEFGRISALAVRRFAAFSIPAGFLIGAVTGIKSAVAAAVEYDKQMNRLQQVTMSSKETLSGLSSEITRLSTELGVTSKSISEIAVTLASAGYTAKDVKVALETLAQTQLSSQFEDIKASTDGAIAAMQQFKLQASDLSRIFGEITAVSRNFAVESRDIVSAIQHSGGAFRAAGGNLEELMAMFTAVRSTTRESADSIATGLRTIFTRIERPRTIEFLRQLGVELQDAKGMFVGPYEAIKRLSAAMKELDTRDIRYATVVEELGGYRQVSKVIPLLQEFGTAQKALAVAQAGSNALSQEAAIAQDALATKIVKVKEEWLKLGREVVDSKGFKILADSAMQFATALTQVLRALQPVLPLLVTLGSVKALASVGAIGKGFMGKFAAGGVVPGSGNGDTVPAMLTPGEFVIRKSAVQSIGTDKLHAMNSQKFYYGGSVSESSKISKVMKDQLFQDLGFGPGQEYTGLTPEQRNIADPGLRLINKGHKLSTAIPDEVSRSILAEAKIASRLFREQGVRPQVEKRNPAIQMVAQASTTEDVVSLATPETGASHVKKPINVINMGATPSPGRGYKGYSIKEQYGQIVQKSTQKGIISAINNAGLTIGKDAYPNITGHNFKAYGPETNISNLQPTVGIVFENVLAALGAKFTGGLKPGTSGKSTSGDFLGGVPEHIGQLLNPEDYRFNPNNPTEAKAMSRVQQSDMLKKLQKVFPTSILYNQARAAIKKTGSFEGLSLGMRNRLTAEGLGPTDFFADGGSARGGSDTVPAMLTPGEFVMSKSAVDKVGLSTMHKINKFATGGPVAPAAGGGNIGAGSMLSMVGFGMFSGVVQSLFGMESAVGKATQALTSLLIAVEGTRMGMGMLQSTIGIQSKPGVWGKWGSSETATINQQRAENLRSTALMQYGPFGRNPDAAKENRAIVLAARAEAKANEQISARRRYVGGIGAGIGIAAAGGSMMLAGSYYDEKADKNINEQYAQGGFNPNIESKVQDQKSKANWLGNLGTFTAMGAGAGAAFGPIGMAIGAAVGFVVGAGKSWYEMGKVAKETSDKLRDVKFAFYEQSGREALGRISSGKSFNVTSDTAAANTALIEQLKIIRSLDVGGKDFTKDKSALASQSGAYDMLKQQIVESVGTNNLADFKSAKGGTGSNLIQMYAITQNIAVKDIEAAISKEIDAYRKNAEAIRNSTFAMRMFDSTLRNIEHFNLALVKVTNDLSNSGQAITAYGNIGNGQFGSILPTASANIANAGSDASMVSQKALFNDLKDLFGGAGSAGNQMVNRTMDINTLMSELPNMLRAARTDSADMEQSIRNQMANRQGGGTDQFSRLILMQFGAMMGTSGAKGGDVSVRRNIQEDSTKVAKELGGGFAERWNKAISETEKNLIEGSKKILDASQQYAASQLESTSMQVNIAKNIADGAKTIASMKLAGTGIGLGYDQLTAGFGAMQSAQLKDTKLGGATDITSIASRLGIVTDTLLGKNVAGQQMESGLKSKTPEEYTAAVNLQRELYVEQKRLLGATNNLASSAELAAAAQQKFAEVTQAKETRNKYLEGYISGDADTKMNAIQGIKATAMLQQQPQFLRLMPQEMKQNMMGFASQFENVQLPIFGQEKDKEGKMQMRTGRMFKDELQASYLDQVALPPDIQRQLKGQGKDWKTVGDAYREQVKTSTLNPEQELYLKKLESIQETKLKAEELILQNHVSGQEKVFATLEGMMRQFVQDFGKEMRDRQFNEVKIKVGDMAGASDIIKGQIKTSKEVETSMRSKFSSSGAFNDLDVGSAESNKKAIDIAKSISDNQKELAKIPINEAGINTLAGDSVAKMMAKKLEGRRLTQKSDFSQDYVKNQAQDAMPNEILDMLASLPQEKGELLLDQAHQKVAASGDRGSLRADGLYIANTMGSEKIYADALKKIRENAESENKSIIDKTAEGASLDKSDAGIRATLASPGMMLDAKGVETLNTQLKILVDFDYAKGVEGLDKLNKDLQKLTEELGGLSGASVADLIQVIEAIGRSNISASGKAEEFRANPVPSAEPLMLAPQFADGGSIFQARGTDTVPAMLTPGEFVVKREMAQKHRGLLQQINSGSMYLADGGDVYQEAMAFEALREQEVAQSSQPGETLAERQSRMSNLFDNQNYVSIEDRQAASEQLLNPEQPEKVKELSQYQQMMEARKSAYATKAESKRSVYEARGESYRETTRARHDKAREQREKARDAFDASRYEGNTPDFIETNKSGADKEVSPMMQEFYRKRAMQTSGGDSVKNIIDKQREKGADREAAVRMGLTPTSSMMQEFYERTNKERAAKSAVLGEGIKFEKTTRAEIDTGTTGTTSGMVTIKAGSSGNINYAPGAEPRAPAKSFKETQDEIARLRGEGLAASAAYGVGADRLYGKTGKETDLPTWTYPEENAINAQRRKAREAASTQRLLHDEYMSQGVEPLAPMTKGPSVSGNVYRDRYVAPRAAEDNINMPVTTAKTKVSESFEDFKKRNAERVAARKESYQTIPSMRTVKAGSSGKISYAPGAEPQAPEMSFKEVQAESARLRAEGLAASAAYGVGADRLYGKTGKETDLPTWTYPEENAINAQRRKAREAASAQRLLHDKYMNPEKRKTRTQQTQPGTFRKRYASGYEGGGSVDSVPAMLTPGEFVLNRATTQRVGEDNLQRFNNGGTVQYRAGGGTVSGGTASEMILSNAAETVMKGLSDALQSSATSMKDAMSVDPFKQVFETMSTSIAGSAEIISKAAVDFKAFAASIDAIPKSIDVKINNLEALSTQTANLNSIFGTFNTNTAGFMASMDSAVSKLTDITGQLGGLVSAMKDKLDITITVNHKMEVTVGGTVSTDQATIRDIALEAIGPELDKFKTRLLSGNGARLS